ncbi:ciliary microtubule inner protein 5 [Eudromia elegans]
MISGGDGSSRRFLQRSAGEQRKPLGRAGWPKERQRGRALRAPSNAGGSSALRSAPSSRCPAPRAAPGRDAACVAAPRGPALPPSPVRGDRVWREAVEAERRGRRSWYQNWSFLKDYDQLGRKKEQQPLPDYVPVFSDIVPNSTNQVIGSRMNTELGKTLANMDYFFSSGRRKQKLEDELLPS